MFTEELVHSSFICDSPKLETTQLSFNMVTKTGAYSTMKYCSAIKRNELLIHTTTSINPQTYAD